MSGPSVQPPTREQIAEAWDRAREDFSIPRERDGGMRPVDAFEAGFRSALALFPQPTPNGSLDLAEQTMVTRSIDGEFMQEGGTTRHWVQALNRAGYVIARAAQPPMAEPVCGGAATNCIHRFRPAMHSMACPVGQAQNRAPAEPASTADMAPGTTFTARHVDPDECGGVDHRWFVIRPGARPLVVSDEGQHWSGDCIDPSTIREVTPPPTTPEARR